MAIVHTSVNQRAYYVGGASVRQYRICAGASAEGGGGGGGGGGGIVTASLARTPQPSLSCLLYFLCMLAIHIFPFLKYIKNLLVA